MIPKSGTRFPARAKPLEWFIGLLDASAGEGRSEKAGRSLQAAAYGQKLRCTRTRPLTTPSEGVVYEIQSK